MTSKSLAKSAAVSGRAVPLDQTRIGKPRRRSKNMGSGGACPHHGRKGKAPSGAEGVPPSTAVDRRRRGLHRGHRPRAAWAPRTHRHARANSQRKGRTERERTAAAVVVLAVAGGAPTAGLGRRRVEPPGEPGGSSREEKRREAGGNSATPPGDAAVGGNGPAARRPPGLGLLQSCLGQETVWDGSERNGG
jgi:hypothetical protein